MNFAKPITNLILALFIVSSITMCGCNNQRTADNDHDHKDVFHEHGPHAKGECFRFEENTDFAMEIALQGQNNFVRLLFTDYDGKNKLEFAAEMLTLNRPGDKNLFVLTAIPGEKEGMLKGYELDDEDLKDAISVPLQATITIDGTEYKGTTKPPHK